MAVILAVMDVILPLPPVPILVPDVEHTMVVGNIVVLAVTIVAILMPSQIFV